MRMINGRYHFFADSGAAVICPTPAELSAEHKQRHALLEAARLGGCFVEHQTYVAAFKALGAEFEAAMREARLIYGSAAA